MADDQDEIKITGIGPGHKKKKKNKKKKRKSTVDATDVVIDESCSENVPSSSGKDQPPNPTDHLSATTEVETTRPRTDSSIQLASLLSSAVKDGEGDSNQEGSSTNKKKKKKKKKPERNASAQYLADDDPINLQEPVHDVRERHEDLEHAKKEDTALHLSTTMGDQHATNYQNPNAEDASFVQANSLVTNQKKKETRKEIEAANPQSGSENGVHLASTTATTSSEMTAVKDHMKAFPLRVSTQPASLADTAKPIQETDEGSSTTRQANREE